MQRREHSFIKNAKEHNECHVLLKRTQKNAKERREHCIILLRTQKNACPTLGIHLYSVDSSGAQNKDVLPL